MSFKNCPWFPQNVFSSVTSFGATWKWCQKILNSLFSPPTQMQNWRGTRFEVLQYWVWVVVGADFCWPVWGGGLRLRRTVGNVKPRYQQQLNSNSVPPKQHQPKGNFCLNSLCQNLFCMVWLPQKSCIQNRQMHIHVTCVVCHRRIPNKEYN